MSAEIVAMNATDARALTDRIKAGLFQLAMQPPSGRKSATKSDSRHVYFILAWRSRMVKIGVARDPHRRLAEIQSMSPEPLELIAYTATGGAQLERSLHRSLDSLRDHGEWFHLTPELIEILMEAAL